MIDYENMIHRDVFEHECKYGSSPSAIFMSRKLCAIIACNIYELMPYDMPSGAKSMYHGIEIKPYYSDKLEYYLVSSGRELD